MNQSPTVKKLCLLARPGILVAWEAETGVLTVQKFAYRYLPDMWSLRWSNSPLPQHSTGDWNMSSLATRVLPYSSLAFMPVMYVYKLYVCLGKWLEEQKSVVMANTISQHFLFPSLFDLWWRNDTSYMRRKMGYFFPIMASDSNSENRQHHRKTLLPCCQSCQLTDHEAPSFTLRSIPILFSLTSPLN